MSGQIVKDELKALLAQREKMEAELEVVNQELSSFKVEDVTDLLDLEGFPKEHLNFETLKKHRQLSNRRKELLHDINDLTDQMYSGLERLHSQPKETGPTE